MMKIKNSKLTSNSKTLRKNMTKEERRLWYDFLKTLPITVHRQKVIKNYIVDFYIAEAKIVIELDGSQHYKDDKHELDIIRDRCLNGLGITVLRYSNEDIIKHFDRVCNDIWQHLGIEDRLL